MKRNAILPILVLILLYPGLRPPACFGYYSTPAKLITISDSTGAALLRKRVIDYLWASKGLPAKLPSSVSTISTPSWVSALGSTNLHHVEKMDILMDYGMHSYAYLMVPTVSVNRLMIYHHGHDGNVGTGEAGWNTATRRFLDKGYAVLMFWLPTLGENSRTAYNVPGRGTVNLGTNQAGHNTMSATLEYPQGRDGSFIRFFIEPIVVGVNYARNVRGYREIDMMGISGGGWATDMCAAIDPRIRYSFPTAGSYPLYLRIGVNGWGDAEQHWTAMYDTQKGGVASWLDIYILGGYGLGRGKVQLLNELDSCCFSGTYYRDYESYVTGAVAHLGEGFFDVHPYQWSGHHGVRSSEVDAVISVLETCVADGYEPDNTCAQAGVIESGEVQERSLCPAGDADWARFTLPRTSAVLVETFGMRDDDTELWLYGPGTCATAFDYDNDSGTDRWSKIDRMCEGWLEPGTYYIRVNCRQSASQIQQYFLHFSYTECSVYHHLTVTGSPSGAGWVEKNPDTAEYGHGSPVVLTPHANAGYVFDSWGGDLTGSANQETLLMYGDKVVTAYFAKPIPQVGALRVTILPQEVLGLGAAWRVDGGSWRLSGVPTSAWLTAGKHTVDFRPVDGWQAPAPMEVTVITGATTESSGAYVIGKGALRVTILPQEVLGRGAAWRVDGGSWRLSGVPTSAWLTVGKHTVDFKPVDGWQAPAPMAVTVVTGTTTESSGAYVAGKGALRVTILPQEVLGRGAAWRVDGGSWRLSGVPTSAWLTVGKHTVDFKPVDGWQAPAPMEVTVVAGATTDSSGTYNPAYLRILLAPSSLTVPEGEGATRLVTLSHQPSGDVTVEAGKVSGDADLYRGTLPQDFCFTPRNWNVGQVFRVNARQDDDHVHGIAVFRFRDTTTAANGYAPADLTATEQDNGPVSIVVEKEAISVVAGETAEIRLKVQDAPAGSVTVAAELVDDCGTQCLELGENYGPNDGRLDFSGDDYGTWKSLFVTGLPEAACGNCEAIVRLTAPGATSREVRVEVNPIGTPAVICGISVWGNHVQLEAMGLETGDVYVVEYARREAPEWHWESVSWLGDAGRCVANPDPDGFEALPPISLGDLGQPSGALFRLRIVDSSPK